MSTPPRLRPRASASRPSASRPSGRPPLRPLGAGPGRHRGPGGAVPYAGRRGRRREIRRAAEAAPLRARADALLGNAPPAPEPGPEPETEPGGPDTGGAPAPLSRTEAITAARDAVRQARAGRLTAEPPRERAAERVPAPRPAGPASGSVPNGAPAPASTSASAPATEPDAGPGPGPVDATRRARLVEAVRDRLPLWVRTRCGVEPRTLAALALALAVALGFAVHHFWGGRPQVVQAPPVESASRSSPVPSPTSSPAPSSAPAAGGPGTASGAALGGGPLLVDVAGEVSRPGVHRLPAGARVADALRAAGGVRPGTDLHGLNRARPLADGEQIVVGEPPTAAAVPGPPAAGSAAGGGPVSLNSATAEQLDTLPGIGPVMAQRIIDHRTERGGFSSVEELREVSGIGERRFAELKPLVGP